MGRKKKDEQIIRPHRITFRLTDAEYDYCQQNASIANLSLSEYIRRMLRQEEIIIRHAVTAEIPEIKAMARALKATANNLNQIARYFHTGGLRSAKIQDEITEGILVIFEIRDQLAEMEELIHGNLKTYLSKE